MRIAEECIVSHHLLTSPEQELYRTLLGPWVRGAPPSLQREDHRVRRHTVASDAWSTGSASTQGDGGVKYPCPLSLAPGTPRCSVGKCAQPTTVTLES
jgi:hypothetical protein